MTVVIERGLLAGIETLRAQIRGFALTEGDAGYDERRAVFNGRYDRRPLTIVAPADASDVATAVRCAKANDLAVAVKGGGHGPAAWAMGEGNRQHEFNLMIETGWVEPSQQDAALAWLDEAWGAVRAHALPVAYANFLDIDNSHRAVEGFGAAKYRRVLDFNAIFDPASLFRSNPATLVLP